MTPRAQTRTRLEVDQRRELLVRAGVELLRTTTPDAISIDAVARQAGISRGLLYHYFEDKDAFVVAVLEAASERLRVALQPNANLTARDRSAAAIDAYIEFAEAHAAGFRAVLTGAVANPKIAAVVNETRERDLVQFVDSVASETDDRAVLRVALHGHMHFMEGAVVRWLSRGEITRAQLRELLLRSLEGTIAAAKATG